MRHKFLKSLFIGLLLLSTKPIFAQEDTNVGGVEVQEDGVFKGRARKLNYGAGFDVQCTARTCSMIADDVICTNCLGGTEIDESTLGNVPSATSATSASTAAALAADPANCATATHFATGVDASGVAECEAIADGDLPSTITRDSEVPGLETDPEYNSECGAAGVNCINVTEVVDEGVSAAMNGDTASGVSHDDLHDYAVIGDPDLDGKPSVLDLASCAGKVITDAGGAVSCGTDDDVPDAGDFGNATDLDANGAVQLTWGDLLTRTGDDVDFDGLQISSGAANGNVVLGLGFGADFSVDDTLLGCVGGSEPGTICTADADCAGSGTCTANKRAAISAASTFYKEGEEILATDLPPEGLCQRQSTGWTTTANSDADYFFGSGGGVFPASTATIVTEVYANATTLSDLECLWWEDGGNNETVAFTFEHALISTCAAGSDGGGNTCDLGTPSALTCTITGGTSQTASELNCSDMTNSVSVPAHSVGRWKVDKTGTWNSFFTCSWMECVTSL